MQLAPGYAFVTELWLERAKCAIDAGDADAALELVEQLVDGKISVDATGAVDTTHLFTPVPCAKCEHCVLDPDPVDPGWPYMCEDSGRDMLDPQGTCWWCSPKTK